jgi:hypothetical protein
MDYVETLDFIDLSSVAVIGHSRLGKTALLAATFDERFAYAISNNSGCAGAAITRGKRGEHILEITNRFPYWFAKRYAKYAADESTLPLDQHFLLAAIAPRKILVGSADEDEWAGPESEFLSAGINQTIHKINLKVSVGIRAVIPGFSDETSVSADYCVAQTVIVGDVPQLMLGSQALK